jgi:hypothetical protein
MLHRRHTRRIVRLTCTLLLAVGLAAPLEATTLVIIRTGDQIVIAADSLMTLYGRRPQLTCKIQRHGDVVFATAGLVVSSGGVVEFHRIIANILRRRLPWREQAASVEEWLRQPLLRTLRRMAREFPDEFQTHLQQRFTFHVSLAGIQQGRPALEMREFFVERNQDGTLELEVERTSCPEGCAQRSEVFGVGETAEMMRRLGTMSELPADLPTLARSLVVAEIGEHPEHVGPPVDVVKLDQGGVDWVDLKPACQT